MPKESQQDNSEYNQQSFIGGMNLLLDDTQLESNQYRLGFNVRNRYSRLDLILASVEDKRVPYGIKQHMTTFGDYEIIFVSGKAYYKFYTDVEWNQIDGFQMSNTAPRFWTEAVPVSTTNYLRLAATANVRGPVNLNNIAGAAAGNLPGLLVQDNINQPVFIFINADGYPEARVTQAFDEWSITFTDPTNTVVAANGDNREYVPVGSAMSYIDGVLNIVSQDGNYILPSVTGRPLDFVRNVKSTLATVAPFIMTGGGDAYTTAYSVGVGGITCLRAMSDGSLFVSAGNSNFSVAKNMSQNAPMEFGEYTYIRKFLFNANCLSDRAIIDTTGDTRFVDLTGIRSFNAISQMQNEGRNSVFSSTIQPAFGHPGETIAQDSLYSAAILYDNYEVYGVSTIFGPVLAIYDTVNGCWSSFDVDQTGGKRVKQLVKIELAVQALYAVTEDDKVYRLYVGDNYDDASVRTVGICSNFLYLNNNIKMASPKMEVKLSKVRVIVNNITEDCSVTFTPFVNNRMAKGKQTKYINYTSPIREVKGKHLSDVNTMLRNILFATPDCEQGWKTFGIIEWTGGSITQFSAELIDLNPQNPLNSQ